MSKTKPKRKASKRPKFKSISITLDAVQLAYCQEVAVYAGTSVDMVCGVLLATGIYQAKRCKPPDDYEAMRSQLRRARACMEANDPGNARDIFGPPLEAPAAEPELIP